MNKPKDFMKHHFKHDFNVSKQSDLKMHHDNDVVWGGLKKTKSLIDYYTFSYIHSTSS